MAKRRRNTAWAAPRDAGLANVAIQSYLTAAVMNLKRLAALLSAFFDRLRLHKPLGKTCNCLVGPWAEIPNIYPTTWETVLRAA
jgi:hypothetical protein